LIRGLNRKHGSSVFIFPIDNARVIDLFAVVSSLMANGGNYFAWISDFAGVD
jgi:hypothetical protein